MTSQHSNDQVTSPDRTDSSSFSADGFTLPPNSGTPTHTAVKLSSASPSRSSNDTLTPKSRDPKPTSDYPAFSVQQGLQMMTDQERYANESSVAGKVLSVCDMLDAHHQSRHTSAVCHTVEGIRPDCREEGYSWATCSRAVLQAQLDKTKAQDTFRAIHRDALQKYGQDIDENLEQIGPKFKIPEYETEYAATVLSGAKDYYEKARERTRQNNQRKRILKPRWRPCGV
jgi:hypothetical protein